ncbi:hypothetical protein, partial [Pseudoalteromonas sp. SYSU M81241]
EALWLVVLLLLLLLLLMLMCAGGLACIDPALVSVEMYCFLSKVLVFILQKTNAISHLQLVLLNKVACVL